MLSQVIYQSHKIPFIGEDEKYHYLYKITNMINGKIYIGIHSTTDLNDRYMGSGKRLLNAFKKYGIKNFNKEILCFCNTREEICQLEKEIVNEEFIKREDVYNLNTGGQYGLHSEETKRKISESNKGQKSWAKGKKLSKEHRERISKSRIGYKHSEATREKMREAQKGEKSHNYGKKFSEATREKMRKNHKDFSGKNNPCSKRVLKIDRDGNVVYVYDTIKEAAISCEFKHSNCLKHYIKNNKPYKGYYYKIVNKEELSNE